MIPVLKGDRAASFRQGVFALAAAGVVLLPISGPAGAQPPESPIDIDRTDIAQTGPAQGEAPALAPEQSVPTRPDPGRADPPLELPEGDKKPALPALPALPVPRAQMSIPRTDVETAPAKARTLSLGAAVRLAVTSHPTVLRNEAEERAAAEAVEIEEAGYWPSVKTDASVGYDWINSPATEQKGHTDTGFAESVRLYPWDMNLTVSHILWDGFDRANRKASAEARHKAGTFTSANAREEVALKAIESYLDVLRFRELLKAADDHLAMHRGFLDKAQFGVSTGNVSAAEADQIRTRSVLAENRLVQARGNLRGAVARFVEAVGESPDDLKRPVIPTLAVPARQDQAVEQAIQLHPQLKSANYTLKSKEHDLDSTSSVLWPRVTFDMAGGREHNFDGAKGHRNDFKTSMKMSYQLYDGGATIARRREASEKLSAAQQRQLELVRDVTKKVTQAYVALGTTRDQLPLLDEAARRSGKLADAMHRQFDLGKKTMLEVLVTESGKFDAEASVVTSRYAFAFGHFQVLASIGSLADTVIGQEQGGASPKPATKK